MEFCDANYTSTTMDIRVYGSQNNGNILRNLYTQNKSNSGK